MRRTTSSRGNGCFTFKRSEMKFLSSRRLTLKRGWCFLMSSFSRSSASFSVWVSTTSMSPRTWSRIWTKARVSALVK